MKNKILMICISFIFLFAFTTYVLATEIENLEDNVCETPNEIQETKEKIEIKNEIEMPIVQNSIDIIGRSYIDSPSNGKILVKPDCEKIEVIGWAVSNDKGATVQILVDGNVIGNCVRTKRGDVDYLVSPEYGGVELTPNAGFYFVLDSNQIGIGNHKITVQELSSQGNLITSSQTEIIVQSKKYRGRSYIDSPNNAETFIRPDCQNIKVQGWAVSDDKEATVQILLDGNVVGNATRCQRGDVDYIVSPEYGGTAITSKAGIEYSLNIANLVTGKHTITVQELSRYGEVICASEIQIQIENKIYKGRMYIDSPNISTVLVKQDVTEITCIGWAVSTDKDATIQVFLDGERIGEAYRTIRGDVDYIVSPEYGGTQNTPRAGFEYVINISQMPVGRHTLVVQETSQYGDIISVAAVQIDVKNKKYRGKIYLETPTQMAEFVKQEVNNIKIEGWAVSTDKEATIRVILDGTVLENKCHRIERGDVDRIVSPEYGGVSNTPKAGFYTAIDITQLGIGGHVLRIEEISRYGDLIYASEVNFMKKNKQYLGEMCLDFPRNGTVQKIGTNLIVDGWAVAQDEIASVEIYIDGIFKATAQRYVRPDVVYFMNKYDGKTVNAGFGKLVSTEGLSLGMHTVTVYEKSRYGDIIGGVSATFFVNADSVSNNQDNNHNTSEGSSNNTGNTTNPVINVSGTKGIDVSQFQGTINWRSVANSGIKYAMIRIGYRGYGNGGLVEDSKFKKNFAEAVENGLKVGVYFYSPAINITEARKDAEYVMSILRKYGYQNKVSMPIAIDLELVSGVNTRDKNLSKQVRTNIANTFCQTIASYGYTPMVYACKSFLNDNLYANQIPYDIWVAQYNSKCTYNGKYTVWQYTSSGKISGINGNVDCNICYKNY